MTLSGITLWFPLQYLLEFLLQLPTRLECNLETLFSLVDIYHSNREQTKTTVKYSDLGWSF